ncbi:TVP38/TMEM64 family membrane protein [Mycobacterium tuberculosis]|nr:TVP38/TMEM64 family membrane protein [Mycobacterium tuberculosis variant africanum]AMC69802.1 TVP38/TMEM64 family membrane protein [Mycobacterium tuberculosis]
MTAPAICNTTETVHGIATSLGAVARQASLPRIVGTVVGITVLVVVALLVPVPTAVELRDWAKSLGAWFPLAFLLVHTVVTVPPFPAPRSRWPPGCCSALWWAYSSRWSAAPLAR